MWFYLLLETTAEIKPNNLTDVVFGITDKPKETDVFCLQATTGLIMYKPSVAIRPKLNKQSDIHSHTVYSLLCASNQLECSHA